METKFVAKLEGDYADSHRVPAYEGAKTLYGLNRSLLIVSNYVVEGRIRRKDFDESLFEFNMLPSREGSFEFIYEIVMNPGTAVVASTLGLGVSANFLTDLLRLVYSRVVGHKDKIETDSVERLLETRAGEIDALVDASEPAIRAAHNIINHGALTININNIQQKKNVASLDRKTKSFVWDNVVDNRPRTKLFSVSSFSSNSRSGRVFDFEEGRSISFELSSDIDEESLDNILDSHNNYARRRILSIDELSTAIAMKFTSVNDKSGRLKKIRIMAARRSIQLL